MRKFGSLLGAIFGGILVIGLNAAPAHAQATRTWVSGVGDDANPCSRTAPCKTFAGAISKTAAQGEINVLDPGGFGAVTIIKSITIRSDSVEAGVLVAAGNGINVVAGATDQVTLYGLDIEGLGGGTDGVKLTSGLNLAIIKCNIHHFTNDGVNVQSSTAGARVTVRDSIISFNAGGVNVVGNGVANAANVDSSLLDGNTSFGLQTNNAGNAISVFRSTIIGSPAAVSVLNSSVIASRGPSNVMTGTTTGLTSINFN
jgi:hypothetical protein